MTPSEGSSQRRANAPRAPQAEGSRRIGLQVGSAFLVALLILVAIVLPVEYNLDPLGTGRLLGLVYMGEDQDDPVVRETAAYREDRVEFELTPFESVEYKYGLAKNQAFVFAWQATGEVVSDLHSEPAIGPPGYAESFDQYRGTSASGTYIAPFTGLHGWFWENRGEANATVRLETAGYYDRAVEYRGGAQFERAEFR